MQLHIHGRWQQLGFRNQTVTSKLKTFGRQIQKRQVDFSPTRQ